MFLNADGRLTETGLISRCPAGCSRRSVRRPGRPGRDGRQFHGRQQQTIGLSRAEGTSTRQIGDTNQLTQVWRRSSMSGLVQEHDHLELYSLLSPEPMEADECSSRHPTNSVKAPKATSGGG